MIIESICPWNRLQFIGIANCPSLVFGISGARLDVGHLSVADLPAIAQTFDSPTQLPVAADQRAAGKRGSRARHTRDGRQDVDDRSPPSVVPSVAAFGRGGAAVTVRAQPGRSSGAAEYWLSTDCRRKLALVPLSDHQQSRSLIDVWIRREKLKKLNKAARCTTVKLYVTF